MHCHMLHHVMNQMGHKVGNLIGMESQNLSEKIGKLIPGFMFTGENGNGDMGAMGMPVPPNSIPMVGAQGQHDYITMGGMFTILKVRNELPDDGSDPDWYQSPPGTLAELAPQDDLERDGIELPEDMPKSTAVRTPKKGDAWCGVPPLKSMLQARNNVTAKIKVQ